MASALYILYTEILKMNITVVTCFSRFSSLYIKIISNGHVICLR